MKKKITGFLLLLMLVFSLTSLKINAVGEKKSEESLLQNVTNQYRDFLLKDFNSNLSFNKNEFSLQKYNNSDEYTIIVELDKMSLMDDFIISNAAKPTYNSFENYLKTSKASSTKTSVKSIQNEFIRDLNDLKINYQLNFKYDALFSGVSITLKGADLKKVANLNNVSNIILNEVYSRPMPTAISNEVSVYSSGIYDAKGIDYSGEGVVVAVLDSGIDFTHPAFQTMPKNPSLTKNKIMEVYDRLTVSSVNNINKDRLYLNSKIPYNFDYADLDNDTFPTASSHGIHVSGIIAGEDKNYVFENGDTFKGVATNAQIATFKVFSDFKEGAPSDAILAALSDSCVLGVDIINMSLGSSGGFSRDVDNSAVNKIYDKIRAAGISLFASASNDGSQYSGGTYGSTGLTSTPITGTVGSPSTYDAAMSVASISGQKSPYLVADDKNAIYYKDTKSISGNEFHFTEELLNGESSKTFNYVVVGGYGQEFNYTPDVKAELDRGNTIAVVKRGDTSFEEKQRIAFENGAIGCIIYNNVSGTIAASLGTGKKVPTCTIQMDMGRFLVEKGKGTLVLNKDFKAGPFMSDFSSWGPTDDLTLKPEITAHGGEITSSVAGGYTQMSGTSMSSPNLAGMAALLREYVKAKFPEAKNNPIVASNYLNQLLMSTAQVALDEYGNPYSPRKQGAGNADIHKATNSSAYLWVNNSNKTKIELGDDPKKEGIYTLRFNLSNFENSAKNYKLNTSVMTESLSSDNKTVAEKAYMLSDSKITVNVKNGSFKDGVVQVSGNQTAEIEVRISLTKNSRKYLDDHFENGIYVEGFVQLEDLSETKSVDLSIPYLAFYGDWLSQHIWDVDAYRVSQEEMDDAILDEDKVKAVLYESMLVSKYYKGSDLLMPLGEYIFKLPDGQVAPTSSMDKIAVTNDPNGNYALYGLFAGMLRNCSTVEISVKNVLTKKEVFHKVQDNARKSLSSSSSVYPAGILLELTPYEMGLRNNEQYEITFTATAKYKDRVKVEDYNFSFYIDFEAPMVSEHTLRTVYDRDNNRKVYLDLKLYDNNYVQSFNLYSAVGQNALYPLNSMPIPVDGARGTETKVTVDITPYLDNIGTSYYKNALVINLYDYALNAAAYILPLKFSEIENLEAVDMEGNKLERVTLEKNQIFNFDIKSLPENSIKDDVEINVYNNRVCRIQDNTILATSAGTSKVTITSKKNSDINFSFYVDVVDSDEEYSYDLKEIAISGYNLYGINYQVIDKMIKVDNGTKMTLKCSVKPFYANNYTITWSSRNTNIATINEKGELICFKPGTVNIWAQVKVGKLTLSDRIVVEIGEEFVYKSGYLTGYNGIGGRVVIPADAGYYILASQSEGSAGPFYQNADVTSVIVPEGVTQIGYAAFAECKNLETIYLPSTLESISSYAFYRNDKLKNIYWLKDVQWDKDKKDYVSFEEGINYTKDCTARNLTIGSKAFGSCKSLENMDMSKMTAIHSGAFEYCDSLTSIDLTNARYIGETAFYVNKKLKTVILGESTPISRLMFGFCSGLEEIVIKGNFVGEDAFYKCTNLKKVTFENPASIGKNAFSECKSLQSVVFNSTVDTIGYGAFSECTQLASFILPNGLMTLESYAFRNCTSLSKVQLSRTVNLETIGNGVFEGCINLENFDIIGVNRNYQSVDILGADGNYYSFLFSKDQKSLIFAPVKYNGEYVFTNEYGEVVESIGNSCYSNSMISGKNLIIPEGVKFIGNAAFMANNLLSVVLPTTLEWMGDYAFAYNKKLEKAAILSNLKEIGEYAFYSNISLVDIDLPEGLVTIKKAAFHSCSSLQRIEIPSTVVTLSDYVFTYCSMLKDIIFSENSSLKSMGYSMFLYNAALEEIKIPEGVEYMGKFFFGYTEKLKKVTLPGTLQIMDELLFEFCYALEEVTFGEGIEFIPSYAFAWYKSESLYYNSRLRKVNLPSTVKQINPYAFAACSALEEINLTYVEDIYQGAFMGCANLKTVQFGDSLNYIGVDAFNSTGIESVNLKNVRLIDSGAFYKTNISNVNLENVEAIGPRAFSGCEKLTEVNLLNCDSIYPMAFFNSKNLSKVNMPKVRQIGNAAFFGTALKEIVLPETVEFVGETAFTNCLNLSFIRVDEKNPTYFNDTFGVLYKKLDDGQLELVSYPNARNFYAYEILENTIRIEAWAFGYTKNLTQITMPESLKAVGSYAFYGCGIETGNINYIFKSLRAPALECTYEDSTSITDLYANFTYNFGYVQTNITIPKNGIGYDTFLFKMYFKDPFISKEVKEDLTADIITRIEKLLSNAATKEDLTVITEIERLFQSISTEQKELVSNYYELIQRKEDATKLNQEVPNIPDPIIPPKTNSVFVNVVIYSVLGIIAIGISVSLVLVFKRKDQKQAKENE